MPVDVNKFLPTFIEESLELLLDAENELLKIDLKEVDKESINKIFRCMHSIKGASSVFNFNIISEFCHTLENYLDTIRTEKNRLTQNDIELFLKAIDCIRNIITCIQNKMPIDEFSAKQLNEQFKQKILKEREVEPKKEESTRLEPETSSEISSTGWEIHFTPPRDLFQMNCDPFHVFNTLAESGELDIKANISHLPKFNEFDPTECYISWELKLHANISEDKILDILSWIGNEDTFDIKPILNTTFKKKSKIQNASPNTTGFLRKDARTSIRISIKKIDDLINLIGELIITQSILNQTCDNFNINSLEKLKEGLLTLEGNTRELQSSIMQIRMVPVESVFDRFKRLVYDMGKSLGKDVELIVSGEQTEIDKNMIDRISDPILHLIRNALDHGIESREERKQKNKSSTAVIQLNAYQESDNIIIDVIDDGKGLDKEKIRAKALANHLFDGNTQIEDDQLYQFIFQPGFSTADHLSDISGRGVGLDVVYKSISDLGGEVEIETQQGEGTKFRLRLPLTMAIMDCQLIKICDQIYIIPLINIIEIIPVELGDINQIDNETILYSFRDTYISVIHMDNFFYNKEINNNFNHKILIVVEAGNKIEGLIVDALLTQQQVVIKSIEENYEKVNGISGVTILGNGKVGLIIDIKSVISQDSNQITSLINKKSNETVSSLQNIDDILPYQNDDIFQFLSFLLGDQEYGVDIVGVKEIRIFEEATILPHSPSYLKGVINVRGNIIPVFDLHNKFCTASMSHKENIIILMSNINKKTQYIGIIADEVMNTYSIKYKNIKQLAADNGHVFKKYLKGIVTIDKKRIAIININCLNSVAAIKEIMT